MFRKHCVSYIQWTFYGLFLPPVENCYPYIYCYKLLPWKWNAVTPFWYESQDPKLACLCYILIVPISMIRSLYNKLLIFNIELIKMLFATVDITIPEWPLAIVYHEISCFLQPSLYTHYLRLQMLLSCISTRAESSLVFSATPNVHLPWSLLCLSHRRESLPHFTHNSSTIFFCFT